MAKILLVEDNKDVAYMLREILEKYGHKVYAALNPCEAEETVRSLDLEGVGLDVYLSDTDLKDPQCRWGPDVYKELLERYPAVIKGAKVIGMSGDHYSLDRWKPYQAVTIQKPIHIKPLEDLIRTCENICPE